MRCGPALVNLMSKAVVACNRSMAWANEVAMASSIMTETESVLARYPVMVRVGTSDNYRVASTNYRGKFLQINTTKISD